MRSFTTYVIAAIAFAAGSWLAPWEIVPVIAALLVLLAPARFTPFRLTVAAAVAWGGIFGWTAFRAPVETSALARELAGIVHAPSWGGGGAIVLLTPLLAALLAWSGAAMALSVRERRGRRVASAQARP